MSITSEIERIQGNIADTYDALEAKGATMPATENSANLASTVATVPDKNKYGCTIDNLLGDVDSDGKLLKPISPTSITFTGVKDLAIGALYYKFYNYRQLTSVSFPDLEVISGGNALYRAFGDDGGGMPSLTTVSFPKLVTVSGVYAMSSCFEKQRALTSLAFPELVTISGRQSMWNLCYYCPNLTSISFPKLATISGEEALEYAFYSCGFTNVEFPMLSSLTGKLCLEGLFYHCNSLQSVSFPALTSNSFGSYTDQFNSMLSGCSDVTVHFPSNLQSVIGSWTSVQNGFGGTNTTVLFDLTATS